MMIMIVEIFQKSRKIAVAYPSFYPLFGEDFSKWTPSQKALSVFLYKQINAWIDKKVGKDWSYGVPIWKPEEYSGKIYDFSEIAKDYYCSKNSDFFMKIKKTP